MSSEGDEVQDLILQLKRLQLQQTALLSRLERARGREERTDRANGAAENVGTTREFVIGDRVLIKNPRYLQGDRGKIVKITASRITVEAASGNKIIRAPKNLSLLIV
jgi:hypothetical protein